MKNVTAAKVLDTAVEQAKTSVLFAGVMFAALLATSAGYTVVHLMR